RRLDHVPAVHRRDLQRVGFAPAPHFRMSVSETHRARIAAARGRKADPCPDLLCSLHSTVIATTKGAGNAIAETMSKWVISTSGRGFSYVRFQRRMVWPFIAASGVLPVQATEAFGVSFGSPGTVHQLRKS